MSDEGNPLDQEGHSAQAQRLGVLFVHGIGEQSRGQTLLDCVEPLGRAINQWLGTGSVQGDADVRLDRTTLSGERTEAAVPAHTFMRVHSGGRDSTWLLAESWWARAFVPARSSEVAEWAVLIAPWLIQRYLFHLLLPPIRSYQASTKKLIKEGAAALAGERPSRQRRLLASGYTFYFSGINFLATPSMAGLAGLTILLVVLSGSLVAVILQILLVPLSVLAIVPLTRPIARAVQSWLAGSIGDSYIFASSPLRLSAMATQVRRDIEWLRNADCNSIVIAAHSQGAAVAHEALRSGVPAEVTWFVTYGAGISKLYRLRELRHSPNLLLRHATASFVLIATAISFGVALTRSERDSTVWVALALAIVGSLSWTLLIGIGEEAPLPRGTVALNRTDPQKPSEWLDVIATADPVPDGALVPDQTPETAARPEELLPRTVEVTNFRWPVGDHSGYWKNRDEFALPFVFKLGELAGLPLATAEEKSDVTQEGIRSRHKRTSSLLLTRLFLLASAPALSYLLYNNLNSNVAAIGSAIAPLALGPMLAPFGADANALPRAAHVGVGVAVAVVSYLVLAYFAITKMWIWWNNTIADAICGRARPRSSALANWVYGGISALTVVSPFAAAALALGPHFADYWPFPALVTLIAVIWSGVLVEESRAWKVIVSTARPVSNVT
jgi:hypothetical protein